MIISRRRFKDEIEHARASGESEGWRRALSAAGWDAVGPTDHDRVIAELNRSLEYVRKAKTDISASFSRVESNISGQVADIEWGRGKPFSRAL